MFWGKHFWLSIHMIALGYPFKPSLEDTKNYTAFFENLYHVIPCTICSREYKEYINEHPLTTSHIKDTESLFKWTVDIHNMVNKKLNKPYMSHDVAWNFYTNPESFIHF